MENGASLKPLPAFPADVRLTFSANGNGVRQTIQGTARDLSIGGMCVALSNDTTDSDLDALLRKKVTLTILEGNRTAIDRLTGIVAWRKKVGSNTHPTHIVGIVFGPMAEETEMAPECILHHIQWRTGHDLEFVESSGTTLKSGGNLEQCSDSKRITVHRVHTLVWAVGGGKGRYPARVF